jgi:hypothetical protein
VIGVLDQRTFGKSELETAVAKETRTTDPIMIPRMIWWKDIPWDNFNMTKICHKTVCL